MRTTFTAVLVACLGLIAVSTTASAQWRSNYVSYYGGYYGESAFIAATIWIARARVSAAADTELSDFAPGPDASSAGPPREQPAFPPAGCSFS